MNGRGDFHRRNLGKRRLLQMRNVKLNKLAVGEQLPLDFKNFSHQMPFIIPAVAHEFCPHMVQIGINVTRPMMATLSRLFIFIQSMPRHYPADRSLPGNNPLQLPAERWLESLIG